MKTSNIFMKTLDTFMKTSGIFMVRNIFSEKIFIGYSENLYRKRNLGQEFEFTVLEECDCDFSLERLDYWRSFGQDYSAYLYEAMSKRDS